RAVNNAVADVHVAAVGPDHEDLLVRDVLLDDRLGRTDGKRWGRREGVDDDKKAGPRPGVLVALPGTRGGWRTALGNRADGRREQFRPQLVPGPARGRLVQRELLDGEVEHRHLEDTHAVVRERGPPGVGREHVQRPARHVPDQPGQV